jgi:hypothetical protein
VPPPDANQANDVSDLHESDDAAYARWLIDEVAPVRAHLKDLCGLADQFKTHPPPGFTARMVAPIRIYSDVLYEKCLCLETSEITHCLDGNWPLARVLPGWLRSAFLLRRRLTKELTPMEESVLDSEYLKCRRPSSLNC